MSDRNPTSVRLTPEQEKALEEIGEREDRSQSWLIRRAIDEFIERHGQKEGGASE
ncbi:ribbon-helix-helix domain-containing protein [Actinoallomurus sp. CA-142502]|uniref:ribbon-helix-helix domain-containing protein n=1 Tax=Actinoallomurus sp. CA-142502 TaxID=3239885 RepID=UPI003D8FB235